MNHLQLSLTILSFLLYYGSIQAVTQESFDTGPCQKIELPAYQQKLAMINPSERVALLYDTIAKEDAHNPTTYALIRALLCLSFSEQLLSQQEKHHILSHAIQYCAPQIIKLLYNNTITPTHIWKKICPDGNGHIEQCDLPSDLELLIALDKKCDCYQNMLKLLVQLRFDRNDFTVPNFCIPEETILYHVDKLFSHFSGDRTPGTCKFIRQEVKKHHQEQEKELEATRKNLLSKFKQEL